MHRARILHITMTAMLAALLGPVAMHAQTAASRPCASPEYRQFDFWIGDWVVERPDGKLAGSNRIERVAGSCGLQETWTAATGDGTGRSLNAYSAEDGKWHQVWVGSAGLLMHLTGGLRGKSMVLEGRTNARDKAVILQRVTWTPREDGRVRQLWEQSKDGGKSWDVAFDGIYSKKR